ncbi:DNA mismatch repair endonuclease MutL [Ethanoligenens harbinense]|uniref:DNA mismatch repair protein MutL n=1 Tax=Ethanoligenens harbinense (strain DSM 18485 / JCM 12961 / CGMCC 1.5033 / YUAN-3) TaxID=663278 RepID=E6U2H0_ETHHY|nr:DNA mismatch repair endonuclease MutL [Ethanoligenens harbinense]ADU26261.1 DNA mismatch repair protein MutL [Ethanoligenens harbinense YUAN-3]AVQ95395.1 DNA mismatch repair endonuclease MutL [Ethanoligenens harbinense YUAN-3]AYF38060.1 DNA mismatch repair endonuclease MutL [Ethanoligenens harbinense]AYF40805.1 DNA mismatch repair endonuclease MutL [Ethanoligenens harbinense]QCN91636.1 DNA mismatch repair endonuclease MutL [Ethanoligenens harbinense]
MNRIQVLPKAVAEKIAAGEVVERPASVVKELLENAIDAGAAALTLEIQNGGVRFIRVTDDGSGIPAEDVATAFLRHATSKVHTDGDLEAIGTLGFRGEALASVTAVSKVELITRTADELEGTRIALAGGEVLEQGPAGCPQGTTILVRDLFYNTPARMKFLKKDVTEGNAVRAVAERLALSHPEISLKFIKDGREELHTPGDGKLLSAVHAVLGRDFARDLLPVDYALGSVRITGFVLKPVSARANRNMQFFFLNGRLVKSRTAMAALEQAYKGSIMVGRFPGCVLHIALPPALVDVNVHPAKTEVRFADEHAVFEAVYYAVKNTIAEKDTRPALRLPGTEQAKPAPFAAPGGSQLHFAPGNHGMGTMRAGAVTAYTPVAGGRVEASEPELSLPPALPKWPDRPASAFRASPLSKAGGQTVARAVDSPVAAPGAAPEAGHTVPHTGGLSTHPDVPVETGSPQQTVSEQVVTAPPAVEEGVQPPALRVVGQCFETYILVEEGDALYLIDKHAAHERILYEEIKKQGQAAGQLLLAPRAVTLAREEYAAVLENFALLRETGFDMEDFGGATVLVRSAPVYLRESEIVPAVEELAGKLAGFGKDLTPERIDELYHSVACRAAVKAGDKTGPEEAARLAKRVLELDDVRYCPHGRPVAFVLTRGEIEKQFGRA